MLSRFFTLNELCASPTARERKIDNSPDATQVAALRLLAINILDPIRASLGVPLFVRSGLRVPALNAAVGGKPNSQHMKGEAADLVAPAFAQSDVLMLMQRILALNLPFDQAILEHWDPAVRRARWVHISHRRLGQQRGEVLTVVVTPDGVREIAGLP